METIAMHRSPPTRGESPALDAAVCARALESRDPRFDGIFFVGIRTTMIYCRPICPSRLSKPDRRRYFESAAAAERHGYRPCLRCRPELAPGRAIVDAIPRVARAAAQRIAAGALNERSVSDLARQLGVGERHLRRAMERELGVSPAELAQTHRLLLAKSLLTDTTLSIARVAYASGFQSLRRFNTVFRERYRMCPSALRQQRPRAARHAEATGPAEDSMVRLRLPYRAPLAWDALFHTLAEDAQPGIEVVEGHRYGRTVALHGCSGVVFVEDGAARSGVGTALRSPTSAHVTVDVSVSLLPALMPLMARLRHLLDLDAEPGVIDAHLARAGLHALVARCPGLRVPGALDGFEGATRELLRPPPGLEGSSGDVAARLIQAVGETIETGNPALCRLWPTPDQVLRAGKTGLVSFGVPQSQSEAIVRIARAVARGGLGLEPGADFSNTVNVLIDIAQLDEQVATAIAMRALHWPDAFPTPDVSLQQAARVTSRFALLRMADQWRPWRTYAAAHLSLCEAQLREPRASALA